MKDIPSMRNTIFFVAQSNALLYLQPTQMSRPVPWHPLPSINGVTGLCLCLVKLSI